MPTLRYNRTFLDVDEGPTVMPPCRSSSVPPARHAVEDEDANQVRRDLATLYERMAEWKPDLVSAKADQSPPHDLVQDEVSSGPRASEEPVTEGGAGASESAKAEAPATNFQDEMSSGPRASEEPVTEGGAGASESAKAEALVSNVQAAKKNIPRNPGSFAHPEVCRKPCVFFHAGHCENGDGCGYCHMLHGKPSMPDRRQRTFLRKLRATELLHIFLPLLRLRASRNGFWDEATRVLGILEASVQKEGPPNRAKLFCDDAEYLREILTRMSFGSLMTMLLHNLGPSTLVTNARHELETLRQMLPSHA